MFSAQRLAWVVLVLAYFLVLLLLRVVPFIGPYAMTVMKPVLAVGLLAAAWTQERGGTPTLRQLFQGFRANLWALLSIGVFFVVGITLAVFASSLVDDGKLLELMGGGARADRGADRRARSPDGDVQLGMLFSALLSLPVVIATWWAPALVVFQDAPPARRSPRACARRSRTGSRSPIYGLAVFFYGGVVPGTRHRAASRSSCRRRSAQLLVIALLLPYSLFFAATLHISDYVSYRDVFHAGETLAPLPTARLTR